MSGLDGRFVIQHGQWQAAVAGVKSSRPSREHAVFVPIERYLAPLPSSLCLVSASRVKQFVVRTLAAPRGRKCPPPTHVALEQGRRRLHHRLTRCSTNHHRNANTSGRLSGLMTRRTGSKKIWITQLVQATRRSRLVQRFPQLGKPIVQ